MFRCYVFIFLSCIPSLNYGMFPLSWDSCDWSFTKQPRILSEEEKKQQEKEAYNQLHVLVLSRITNKEDLNQPISGEIGKTTPLSRACSRGDTYLSITQLLLAHGANPNVIDGDKSTPLHDAVSDSALETVKLLLSACAHPDYKNFLFGTPLQKICEREDILHDENIAKKKSTDCQNSFKSWCKSKRKK